MEKQKKFSVKTFVIALTFAVIAAIAGFVLCVVFKALIANVSKGLKTQFYLYESIALSEYEEKYGEEDTSLLIWEIDDDRIVNIIEEDGVKKFQAVGIGNTTVKVLRNMDISQEKSVVDTLEMKVSFYDAVVDSAVRSELELQEDDKIYSDHINGITSLNLSGASISNYGDFAFFPNLKYLNLSSSSVSALGEAEGAFNISMLNLDCLNLSGCGGLNDISALYDSDTKVKEVDLSGSAIKEIYLSNLAPSIKKVNISGSGVARLTMSGNSLEEVVAEDMLLSSDVKISDMSELRSVSLNNTQMSALHMSGNLPKLSSLNLASDNILGDISLNAQLPALTTLNLSGVTVQGGMTARGSLSAIDSLNLGKAKVNGSLNVTADLQKAVSLNLGGINVRGDINLSPNAPQVRELNFDSITIGSNLAVGGSFAALPSLNFGGLAVSGDFQLSGSFAAAKTIALDGMATKSIVINAKAPLVSAISLKQITCLNNFSLANSYPQLVSLNLSGAKVTGAVQLVAANAKLETLDMTDSQTAALSLNAVLGLTQIKTVGARINSLLIGSDASLAALTSLSFGNCGLASVSLNYSAFSNLSAIDFSNNLLTAYSLPAKGISTLNTLNLANNSLLKFEVEEGNTSFTSLDLRNNKLSEFVLSGSFANLDNVDISGNSITEINLTGAFPALVNLDFLGNSDATVVLDGDFKTLTAMSVPAEVSSLTLNGSFAKLSAISAGKSSETLNSVGALSLGGSFDTLTAITLTEAGIRRFTLATDTRFPVLKTFQIGDNVLIDLELAGEYPALETLTLTGLSTTAGGVKLSGVFPVLREINADSMRIGGAVTVSGTFSTQFDMSAASLQGTTIAEASVLIFDIDKLKTLSLVNANLSQASLESLSGLTALDLTAASVSSLNMTDLSALAALTLTSAFIESLNFCESFASLTDISFANANINAAALNATFEKLVSLNLTDIGLNSITFGQDALFEGLTSLNLSGNKISRLTFGISMPALKTLNLANNSFRELTLNESFPELTSLSIAGNGTAAQKMNFTLAGAIPLLDTLNISDCNFARFSVNGQFNHLEKISLVGVPYNDFYFGENSKPQNYFTVAFTAGVEYVYGNLPMPVPFALTMASTAAELADKANRANGNTVVCAVFDDNFANSAVNVSADAPRFGIYGKGKYINFYIKSSGGNLSELYFYDLTLSSGNNTIIDATNCNDAILQFYGSCTLNRTGQSSSPAATVLGNTLEIYNYKSLTICAQNGADATVAATAGYAGGSAISCKELSFDGTGTAKIYGGAGGNGASANSAPAAYGAGANGNSGDTGGAGGKGGNAVSANNSFTVLGGSLDVYGGQGGDGARGGNGSSGNTGAAGSKGKNGGRGGQGGDGGNGGAGGAGGYAIESVVCSFVSSAIINLFGGSGGSGGRGGDGGIGGQGGKGFDGEFLGATGTNGGNGGYGGNGGKGGASGEGGNVFSGGFVSVTQSYKGTSGTAGSSGSAAHGGAGGKGGSKVLGGSHESGTGYTDKYGH